MNFQLFGEQTDRLVFKKLEQHDFSDCLRFFFDPRSNKYWKSDLDTPLELANQWFAKQQWRYENNMGAINLLIKKQSNEIIGWCGLIIQTVDGKKELEVAYSIIPTHWKNGYATEAAKKCMECAFHNNWAESVISIIHVDNVESQRVALKNGLTADKSTVYHDNPVIIFRVGNHASLSRVH